MRIAVPVSNDRTAETLSGIEGFQFFEDDHGRIVRRFFVPRAGEGAAAAVAQLEPYGVDALVCGALPGDERLETAAAGILLFPTFSGTPEEAARFSKTARENGFGAVIAAAGMAAHLAGAVAANTTLPVIGIPIKSGNLGGIDALLSTVQMPSGIPVATVAIDGAVNAALLCIEILSVTDGDLAEKLDTKRKADAERVLEKNAAIEKEFN